VDNDVSKQERYRMTIPTDLKYAKSHEWARLDGDIVTVGITQYAVEQLGDIVFVELPQKGRAAAAGQSFGVIESVKAAVELYSPVSGAISDSNQAVTNDFEPLGADPYGQGWMIRVKIENPNELDDLMTAQQYEEFLQSEQANH